MSMSIEREELAREIFIADNSGQPRETSLMDWKMLSTASTAYAYGIADGLLAEMLKPLLAEVWESGFSGGFELAADDIGAWDVLTDHGVTLADYGLTNPYKEETE